MAFYFFPPGLVHTKRLPSHATGALEGTGRTRRSVDATSCRAGGVGVLTLPRQNLTRAPPKNGGGSLGLLFFSTGPSPHEASPKPRYWRVGGHMTYTGIGWCNVYRFWLQGGGGVGVVTLPRKTIRPGTPLLESGI